MKPALLASAVALALALSCPRSAADDAPLPAAGSPHTATAEALVDALVKEDFAVATARFDVAMKRAMPEPRLREMWLSLTQQVGPFRERTGARTETLTSGEAVYVLCEFKEFTLEAKVVFNAQGEVAALRFAPPPKRAAGS